MHLILEGLRRLPFDAVMVALNSGLLPIWAKVGSPRPVLGEGLGGEGQSLQ
jgi:hypothetical protein